MTATRRVRCKGPLCAKKPKGKQLHPREETVRLPGGDRMCVACVAAVGAKKAPEAAKKVIAAAELPFDLPLEPVSDPEPEGEDSVSALDIDEPEAPPVDPDEKVELTEAGREALQAQLERSLNPLPAPTIQVDIGDPLEFTRFPEVQVEGWPLRKGRLSASALGTFVTCPEKFRRKQILGEREPSNGGTIAGGAAHKAVEANYRYMMAAGTPAPPHVWQEWLNAKFDREVERESGTISWGRQSWGDKEDLTADDVRTRATTAAETYIEFIAPLVHPVAVEQPFVTWVEGCPVPIVGSKDLVTEDDIVDVKFGKVHNEVQPDWRLQGLIYLLTDDKDMAWHCVGWPKKDGSSSYRWPGESPALRFRRSYERYSIATDLVRSVVGAIMAYAQQFGTDQPWPANLAHTYACDYCIFRKNETCPWWNRNINAEDLL